MRQGADKVDAIYELRKAAEDKAHAEHALEEDQSAEARDVLLDAKMKLEASTMKALEVCHECDEAHGPDKAHKRPS